MGLALPNKRITVNLASADLLKEGSHFDLPIAIGLLAAMDALPMDEIGAYMVLGELGLDGGLTRVTGVLPAAIHANASGQGLIFLGVQGPEAAWAGEVEVLAPPNLLALVNHFKGTQVLTPPEARLSDDAPRYPDMADIKGQEATLKQLQQDKLGLKDEQHTTSNGGDQIGDVIEAVRQLNPVLKSGDASAIGDVNVRLNAALKRIINRIEIGKSDDAR